MVVYDTIENMETEDYEVYGLVHGLAHGSKVMLFKDFIKDYVRK